MSYNYLERVYLVNRLFIRDFFRFLFLKMCFCGCGFDIFRFIDLLSNVVNEG